MWYQFIRMSPIADENVVDTLDNRYFHFFLISMTTALPYSNLFPDNTANIFPYDIICPIVRNSLLSLSSMIVDSRLQRSMDRFYIHYIASLQNIQRAIECMNIDEGVAIAVFLILRIDMVRAEFQNSRKHLGGLYLLFQDDVHISPLIMQIWPIAVCLDFTSVDILERPILPTNRYHCVVEF